jgi:hypothetical protein
MGYVAPSRLRQQFRSFGVEIEFKDLSREQACRVVEEVTAQDHVPMLEYHGRTCQCCGRRVSGFTKWKVERDGSVSVGSYGGEVITPILRGEEGLEQLRAVMRALREAGATVDRSCGMHVHVSVQDLSNSARAELVRQWYRHHDTFDRFIAKYRTKQGYDEGDGASYRSFCPRASHHEWDDQASAMERSGRFGYTDKYRSLNLTPYAKYGTLEFRGHQGSLNGRKASNWVRLLVGFIDAISENHESELADGLGLLGSLVDLGKIKQDTAAYLTLRAEQLAR